MGIHVPHFSKVPFVNFLPKNATRHYVIENPKMPQSTEVYSLVRQSTCCPPWNSPHLHWLNFMKQESWAIAKMTTRCTLYMGALKIFERPWKSPQLLFPKFLMGFCSDRSYECAYEIWSSAFYRFPI